VQTITAWVRLTPGELDTAAKAAAGRTNKAVVVGSRLTAESIVTSPASR
jgi:hypothetical protein